VGRYEVLAPLATGGMAEIFVVRLSGAGGFRKLLALKVLKPELAQDPYFVDMFLDESRIVSQLSHPNVVQVFDVVVHRGLPCMVMEFLRGRSLSVMLRALQQSGRRIDDAVAAYVLEQTALGLQAAHGLRDASGQPMNLVHRDVSPDNIQICMDGAVKVVDFGIASTRARMDATRHGEFKGKIRYAAPERLHAPQTVDASADAWSLGVVGWELFTNRPLFDGAAEAETMWKVLNGEIPSLADERPDLPPEVGEAIMAVLERSPRERSGDLGAFAVAMRSLGTGAQPRLAQELQGHFDLGAEHEALLGTIARELELRRTQDGNASRPRRRWGWAAAGVAFGGTALTVALMGVPSDDPPAEAPRAQAEPTDPSTPVAAPEAAPPVAQRTADAAPSPPVEAAREPTEPETSPVPPRKPKSRKNKRTKKAKKPQPSSGGGDVFGNPYGSAG
jgi:serine/threonine protein kinase